MQYFQNEFMFKSNKIFSQTFKLNLNYNKNIPQKHRYCETQLKLWNIFLFNTECNNIEISFYYRTYIEQYQQF